MFPEHKNLDLAEICSVIFHKAYSDTVNLPENIRKSLALRDRINLIGLKLSNDLANYDENENLNLGREKNTSVNYDTSYFTIPFEPALLEDELTKDLSDYIKMREESKTSHGDGYLEVEEESRKWMTGRFSK